jgi:G6PDH family F420-dependent oxidoreductase
MQIGLKLFAEAFSPTELVRHAVQAEQAGFDFVEMSDHFHPWLDHSEDLPLAGHSGFAWSVLGMIAGQTGRIRFGTGITCPTVRYHPAIIAQAAATMAILSNGRFFLGVGSGERLNEHIVGRGWNSVPVRHEMLREALHIINALWSGGFHSFDGKHLKLEDARVYDLPEKLPEIIVAAAGPRAARIAAEHGGMITTVPDPALVAGYRRHGGSGIVIAEALVAYAGSKKAGLRSASRAARWGVLGAQANAEIPRASVFEAITQVVQVSDLESIVVAGPDPADYLAQAQKFAAAGIDSIAYINASPEMDAFFAFAAEHLVPAVHSLEVASPTGG